jgi:exosortase C (VPDSG-CTERM-specific)
VPPSALKTTPKPLLRCGWLLLLLVAAFAKPLYDLAIDSFNSELHSHALLIPAVVAYMIYLRKKEIPATLPPDNYALSAIPAMLGAASLGVFAIFHWQKNPLSQNDYLSLTIFAFVCLALAVAMATLSTETLRPIAYPLAMLFFIVPFPDAFTNAIETFFQHTSAEAANLLFALTGQSYMRQDLIFQFPGITPIAVAPECSGIRSSLVLFICSLLAGWLFLKKPTFRAILAISVIPLGILRNGFRIFTIAMLCTHVDPEMIHSPIHTRGGPLFFLLSLIPFFLLLFYLRYLEKRRRQ